ncbi:MAG: NAD-dependent protein deacylase [Chloroflexota bacterium]
MERAAHLLAEARRGLVFTGAGVSTESGIRDFRGPNGLWKQYDPYKTADIRYFMEDPARYWTIARERWSTYKQAHPNSGHYALAAMEEAGHFSAVVTQNTDGLHAAAGSRRVIELHGNGREVVCLDCGGREPRADVQARLETEMPPRCRLCTGTFIKPAVVFFGEALPQRALLEAYGRAGEADLVLVVGSSLQVYPAADIPLAGRRAGAPLLIVNEEPTPFDELAEVVIRGKSGEVLPALLEKAQQLAGA